MGKTFFKKKATKGGNLVRNLFNARSKKDPVAGLLKRGEEFGNLLIGAMSTFAVDPEGAVIATIALSKTYGVLKAIMSAGGIDVESLYDSLVPLYEAEAKEFINPIEENDGNKRD